MKINIVNTSDKSDTLYSNHFNEHYHSTYGAYSESMHVFIESGFNFCNLKSIKIFEVGFGTGLNAILTFLESIKKNIQVDYSAIELYPIDKQTIEKLNFNDFIPFEYHNIFKILHSVEWNQEVRISEHFKLNKAQADFNDFKFSNSNSYDLIYFDAFAPEKQLEMWSLENFSKLFNALNNQGILTTYSSKGLVKNNLRNAGFNVKRLPGPKGKRHILRATKKV